MDVSDQISKKLYLSENKSQDRILKIGLRKILNLNNLTLMETTRRFMQHIHQS